MQAITFSLGRSRVFAWIFSVAYGATIVMVLGLPLSWWGKLIGVAFLLVDAKRLYRLHVTRISGHSVVSIWQTSRGQWGVAKRGQAFLGRLTALRWICPWFCVVRIKTITRLITVLVPADALGDRDYRLLLVRLRFFQ